MASMMEDIDGPESKVSKSRICGTHLHEAIANGDFEAFQRLVKDGAPQRFVSSTRNIEVLLSHTHSIVCDNDIGGLFLGCSKSCKMAAHNLKIHFNSLFMILHKKVSKMFRRVFSLIEKYVL